MKIPNTFYGLTRDVKARCRKLVKRLARGESWQDTVCAEESVDTKDKPGLIVLNGPSPLLGGEPHFHCYILLDQLKQASFASENVHSVYKQRITAEIQEEVFEASLQTSWGLLGLLAYQNVMWFAHPQYIYSMEEWKAKRYQPLLIACIQYWNELYAEGTRFSDGSTLPKNLWNMHTNLKYVLANMGISTEMLNSPLSEEEVVTLLTLAQ